MKFLILIQQLRYVEFNNILCYIYKFIKILTYIAPELLTNTYFLSVSACGVMVGGGAVVVGGGFWLVVCCWWGWCWRSCRTTVFLLGTAVARFFQIAWVRLRA
jgi:hypothetical protein